MIERRIEQVLASIDGKLSVLVALNIAMLLAALGPYLAKIFLS